MGTEMDQAEGEGFELEASSGRAARARCRNPERSEGLTSSWRRERDSNLRRLAGVSAAAARCRNPERSEGLTSPWRSVQSAANHSPRKFPANWEKYRQHFKHSISTIARLRD
jgi:hypothetical protein